MLTIQTVGPRFSSVQSARSRDSSPMCLISGSALPTASGGMVDGVGNDKVGSWEFCLLFLRLQWFEYA